MPPRGLDGQSTECYLNYMRGEPTKKVAQSPLFKSIPTVFTFMKQVVVCRLRKTTAGSILVANPATRMGHWFSQKPWERVVVESPEGRPLGFKLGRVFKSFAQSLLVRACSKGERKHFTPVMALQIHWNEPLIIEYTSFLEQIWGHKTYSKTYYDRACRD